MDQRLSLAVVVFAAVVAGCGSTPVPTNADVATPSPTPGFDDAGFPLQVLGMPVLSVGGVNQLIAQGKLDGRVAAVGGYWVQPMIMSCPAPNRWIAPLESWCERNMFASKGFSAMLCNADRTSCSSNGPPPGIEVLEPISVGETSGFSVMEQAVFNSPIWREAGYVPAVLIGHIGDARQWECPAETRAGCAQKFVIDRVAWVDGQAVAAEIAGEHTPVATRMTADEAVVAAQAGAGAFVVIAALATEIPTFDPRLKVTGDSVMWLVRTIDGVGADAADDPTRSATESLVADATGEVVDSFPLAATDFAPAVLHLQATSGAECCQGRLNPGYEIDESDGTTLLEFEANGWASGAQDGGTRWGAGAPALLSTGDYLVRAWLSSPNANNAPRQFECQTTISLVEGQESRVQAAFPADGPCEFVDPTFVNPFDQ
jgi:hypothetical protein